MAHANIRPDRSVPLRQLSLSPAIVEVWKILEENQLDLRKGEMSTMVVGEAEKVFGAVREVFLNSAEKGPLAMVVTFANACPI